MSIANANYHNLNQSSQLVSFVGPANMVAVPNQNQGQLLLAVQPSAWPEALTIDCQANNQCKSSSVKAIQEQPNTSTLSLVSNSGFITIPQTSCPSVSSTNTGSMIFSHQSSGPSTRGNIPANISNTVHQTSMQNPTGHLFSSFSNSNVISPAIHGTSLVASDTPSILSGPHQTATIVQQAGGGHCILTPRGNSLPQTGQVTSFTTSPTGPTSTSLFFSPPTAGNNDGDDIVSPQLIAAPSISPMNQLVQVVLANGQLATTTLANLQALGLGTSTINPGTTGQYAVYQTANGGLLHTGVQPSDPLQTQLVANSSGQFFAISPPPSMFGSLISNGSTLAPLNAGQSASQFLQIATQGGITFVQTDQVQPFSPNQALSTCQNSIKTYNTTTAIQTDLVCHQSHLSNSKLSSNVQHKQRKAVSSINRMTKENDIEKQNSLASENSKLLGSDSNGQISQGIQVSLSSNSSSPSNVSSPQACQSTVSSTTSNQRHFDSFIIGDSVLGNDQSNSNSVSVESQTLSPTPPLSSKSSMEPESTTHSTSTVANTINNTDATVVDGVNLEEIKEFARQFKIRRLSLGLTQTQVGQALSATEGPSYSQSAICRFEKLDITPKSAQKIKPILEQWMQEAEERYRSGNQNLTEFIGSENNKKRKRRTSFNPSALEILNAFFEKNTHPSGGQMTELADRLHYDREVVRVWFCNKRQALRNNIKKLEPSHVIFT